MKTRFNTAKAVGLTALLAATAPVAVAAQEQAPAGEEPYGGEVLTTVYGSAPSDLEGLPEGPDVDGFVSARNAEKVQVTSPGGEKTVVTLSAGTQIKSSGGFLGLSKAALTQDQLVNGIPVEIETVEWNGRLVATEVKMKSKDLKMARMIQTGTNQRFAANEAGIAANEAATEALRGRFGDIDNYAVTGVTNVYFDTGRSNLSPEARGALCNVAAQAEGTNNALLLVVGYTDSTGSQEVNQRLSEKRASSVVNYLQQQCKWKPWRMLSPTGMAEADPVADNNTAYGKAQNRRVAVNILVSKSADGL
ncbi:MAG: OmpA family protein [Pseudomonadota bacterium]|nr:OmpA family protein [Pseudomonadota bacterium]